MMMAKEIRTQDGHGYIGEEKIPVESAGTKLESNLTRTKSIHGCPVGGP